MPILGGKLLRTAFALWRSNQVVEPVRFSALST